MLFESNAHQKNRGISLGFFLRFRADVMLVQAGAEIMPRMMIF